MTDTDTNLDRLQDVLSGIPAERDGMTIAELDGYVVALIVCPDTIPPSEWLPGVWGGEHEFADVDEAEATIAVVIEHYNRIARELAEYPEDYAPVLAIDKSPCNSGNQRIRRRRLNQRADKDFVLEHMSFSEDMASAVALAALAISQGDPGSMKAVRAPTAAIHCRTAPAMNSGPLSERM